jgi:arylformamidase
VSRLYDISLTVDTDTPPWPGDTPFSCEWPWLIAKGASVNVSALTASPHVGTHADAPLHVRDGWPAAHELTLDAFLGPAVMIDVTGSEAEISADVLAAALGRSPAEVIPHRSRLLLRTGRTIADGEFPGSWPVLGEAAARMLLNNGLRLLGTDAPSVDLKQSRTLPLHHVLFAGNAMILENLDLRGVPPGEYELMAFPLKLQGVDAAPVRAVLEQT